MLVVKVYCEEIEISRRNDDDTDSHKMKIRCRPCGDFVGKICEFVFQLIKTGARFAECNSPVDCTPSPSVRPSVPLSLYNHSFAAKLQTADLDPLHNVYEPPRVTVQRLSGVPLSVLSLTRPGDEAGQTLCPFFLFHSVTTQISFTIFCCSAGIPALLFTAIQPAPTVQHRLGFVVRPTEMFCPVSR